MFCQECGTENKDGAKFCYKCGRRLVEIEKGNENNRSKEDFNFEDLTTLQSQYIDKIYDEVVLKFCIGREVDLNQFYSKAPLYEMTVQQVNEAAVIINEKIKKMYHFIEIQFEETKDFTIDETEIYGYAESIDLTEEIASSLLEKYEGENQIEKKEEFYQLLLADYLGYETEEDINEYEYLNDIDKDLVTQTFKKNIEEINEFIRKEYTKTEGLDLKSGQLPAIAAEATKIGVGDEQSLISLVKKYEDSHGITELKNEREAKMFYGIENEKLGKNVIWFGKNKTIEGKFFLQQNITNRFKIIENTANKDLSRIDENTDTVLSDLAFIIARYGSEILEELQRMEEELAIPGLPPYFSEIQEYVINKLADITAVSTVIQNIDQYVDAQKVYRETRKQFRNQWSGGGFGIAGALKGAAMAGVLNMGSGAVHSIANAIGNAQTNSKAKAEKIKMIHSVTKDTLNEIRSLTAKLKTNVKNHIKALYPNAFWIKNEQLEEKYYSLFQKNKDDSMGEYAWELLMSNPFNTEYYTEIFKRYSDVAIKQELTEISKIFGLTSVSNNLNTYIDQNIKKDFKRISIGAIDDIQKWLYVKHENLDNEEIKRKLIETLFDQLKVKSGKKLDDFVNCLIDYKNTKNDPEWSEIYDGWVKDIAKTLEYRLDNEVNELDLPSIEERMDNLIILKKIAGDITRQKIETIVSNYVKIKIGCISARIDIYDLESIRQKKIEIEQTQKKYNVVAFSIFETRIIQELQVKIVNCKEKEEVYKLQETIKSIEEFMHIDIGKEKIKIKQLLDQILCEERTVYDYDLEYYKEIKRKKPDIVQKKEGIVFQTIEEAEEMRLRLKKIVEIYRECEFFSYESVKTSITKIETISDQTELGKEILENLSKQLKKLDIERRTVLGITYDTFEEAENERKKVVGNKKFDSEEAANAERIRLQKEREISEKEGNLIKQWENQYSSPIDILKNILEKNFISIVAKNKEKEYSEKVLKIYSSLKDKNISIELARLRTKQLLCIVFGVIAILIGIGPFLSGGWIAKIVIFIVVAIPWGIMAETKESIESYSEDKKLLKYLEDAFIIQGQLIKLRNTKGNSKMNFNEATLVKVCVVEKYKDSERGEVLEPGFIFSTSVERANQLVKEKVAKRLD